MAPIDRLTLMYLCSSEGDIGRCIRCIDCFKVRSKFRSLYRTNHNLWRSSKLYERKHEKLFSVPRYEYCEWKLLPFCANLSLSTLDQYSQLRCLSQHRRIPQIHCKVKWRDNSYTKVTSMWYKESDEVRYTKHLKVYWNKPFFIVTDVRWAAVDAS